MLNLVRCCCAFDCYNKGISVRPFYRSYRQGWQRLRFCLLVWVSGLCVLLSPGLLAHGATPAVLDVEQPIAQTIAQTTAQSDSMSARALEQQGRALYETGRFTEAVVVLQQAIATYQQQGDILSRAIALGNLSLAYQQLGTWPQANEAVQSSLTLLTSAPSSTNRSSGMAQVLDIQGGLQLAQGQIEQALASWQQAAEYYPAEDDSSSLTQRFIENQINQSRALQTLGFYRKALTLLEQLSPALVAQPDSLTKVAELRSLGEALRAIGNLAQAQARLEESLAIAQTLQVNLQQGPTAATNVAVAIAQTQLSLGNTARAQQNNAAALDWYQQAAESSDAMAVQLQSNLNRLSLLVEREQSANAQALIPNIQQQLETLPLSRTTLYAQINLAESLSNMPEAASTLEAATLLATAAEQSEQIGDRRTQSYALGLLGERYEATQQWASAQALTQQALQLATAANAADITYLWQWQLGRIAKAQSEQSNSLPAATNYRTEAITAYQQAIKTLQSLRLDIASINQTQQFSFKESVEPAYREQIELLLHPVTDTAPSQENLTAARDALESLQTVELQNFFREACIDVPIAIDQVVEQTEALSQNPSNARAAIIYPIILKDSFEVVLKLPNQSDLLHYSTAVSQQSVEETLLDLRSQITQPESQLSVETLSQQVYDWLIRPATSALNNNQVGTLVFVLDGFLKNIPMAALYDGDRYLVETYGIALTPGLELLDPQPIDRQNMRLLFAGLSEPVANFSSLTAVEQEKDGISAEIPRTTVLLNQSFTADALEAQIEQTPFQVVHLATHGEFSSDRSKTFILSGDRRISVDELSQILQTRQTQPAPIELLTLSACQTAAGDERAALGLAGIAVRAGARSTLASLWGIDDQSSAFLMTEFYRQLVENPSFSKSQALRLAQLKLINHPNYNHPSYWSPYVLLGNWL